LSGPAITNRVLVKGQAVGTLNFKDCAVRKGGKRALHSTDITLNERAPAVECIVDETSLSYLQRGTLVVAAVT